jgi:hypothetical protein
LTLMIYYIAFVLVGDAVAYVIGLLTEYAWGSYTSLVVFLASYFVVLWLAWLLAVWVTGPKSLSARPSR